MTVTCLQKYFKDPLRVIREVDFIQYALPNITMYLICAVVEKVSIKTTVNLFKRVFVAFNFFMYKVMSVA